VKKLYPVLIAGFSAGVFEIVPMAKSLSCCLILPVAVLFSLYLEMKSTNRQEAFSISIGLRFGLLTGIFAALFGITFETFVTLITKTNDLVSSFPQMQQMLQSFPVDELTRKEVIAMLENVAEQIKQSGFSPLYTFAMLINTLIVNSIFGLIGGLIGVKILNNKYYGAE